jgi:hypothetical protein
VPEDVAAYLLLAMNLLVVGALLALPVLAVWWLVGRPRPLPPPPASLLAAGPSTAGSGAVDVRPGERVLRRCDDCGVLWKGLPAKDFGVTSLKVRRWMRRRTRARKTDTPTWAKRQGWSRCPSCLSKKVRTSQARRARA